MRTTLIAATFALLSLAGVCAAAESGTTVRRPIHIEAQSLDSALQLLAKERDLQIIYRSEVVGSARTAGVSGDLTPLEALTSLLEGTGLTFRHLNETTVTIEPMAAGEAVDEVAGRELQEVVVTSKLIFTQNDAFGATKMGLAIKDTPQTVNVVTSDLMAFASLKSFEDFYKVDASSTTSHAIEGFPRANYRGFMNQTNNTVRVDGFRLPGNITLDLALFDRFEVVKGPTSTLYGQNSIGGTLNAVSKLPQSSFSGRIDLEGNEFDFYRFDGDVTGPIGSSGAWSYRVVGAYADGDHFIDFVNNEIQLLAPSLEYRPNDSTRMILRAIYQKVNDRFHRASAFQFAGPGDGTVTSVDDILTRVVDEGIRIIDVPRSRFFSMPWNSDEREARFLQFQLDHELGESWTLRGHLQHSSVEQRTNGFYTGGPFDENGTAVYNEYFANRVDNSLSGAEINLFGDITAFGRTHRLFFGLDYTDIGSDGLNDFGATYGFEESLFNAYYPDYTVVAPRTPFTNGYGFIGSANVDSELVGATVQLVLRPIERLSVLLGGRYTHDKIQEVFRDAEGPPSNLDGVEPFLGTDLDTSKFVGQTGITYAITPRLNAYASYGETFEAQGGSVFLDEDNSRPVDPQEGTSAELGLKGDFSEDLSYSLALFDMQRTNISQGDREHPDYVVTLGTQRSRGAELEFRGHPLPQWTVSASFAYLDARYTQGELAGLQPSNAPRFGASVFASYELLHGPMRGLGVGLGIVHKQGITGFDYYSTIDAGQPVTYDFGDFTEVDARLFYENERWIASLAVTNLLDTTYYSQSGDDLFFLTSVNPPRTAAARVGYKF